MAIVPEYEGAKAIAAITISTVSSIVLMAAAALIVVAR